MQIEHLTADHHQEWNAFIAKEPSFALLQSWEWGEFKSRMDWKVFRIAVRENGHILAGAQLLIKSLPMGLGSIAYIPRGPIGSWLDDQFTPLLFSEVHKISRYHRAIFLKIEPPLLMDGALNSKLNRYCFFASQQPNQPQATLILDLTQDMDSILKSMRKKTWQYIKNSVRAGVTVKRGDEKDIASLYDLLRITGKREHFPVPARNYLEEEWHTFAKHQQYVLLMAFYQNQLLAVRTVHRSGVHAAEFHAGSTGNCHHLHPNHLLVWEAIKWAIEQGCQTYDLWGIPDEISQLKVEKDSAIPDRHDDLWGVYQFKRGFTKNVVCYVGAYDYVYNQPMYGLISKTFFSQKMREQVLHRVDSLKHGKSRSKGISESPESQNHCQENQ